MAKTHPLGFRVEPEIKEALEKASKDKERSVSWLCERAIKDWLVKEGYLPG